MFDNFRSKAALENAIEGMKLTQSEMKEFFTMWKLVLREEGQSKWYSIVEREVSRLLNKHESEFTLKFCGENTKN